MARGSKADGQEIPLEELNADDNAKIVNLFHYAKDPSRPHGVPCKFVLREVSHLLAGSCPFADTSGRAFLRDEKEVTGSTRRPGQGVLPIQVYAGHGTHFQAAFCGRGG